MQAKLDKRVRNYVAPTKILAADKVENIDFLLTQQGRQTTIWDNQYTIIKRGGSILLDFGKELHGGVRINLAQVSSKAGQELAVNIRIRFGESVSEAINEPDNSHTMHDLNVQIAPMGAMEFGQTGFRFVQVDNLEEERDLQILEISAVSLMLDLEYQGSFKSNDEILNKIWQAGAYTTHLCMQDMLWDGIKRDRLVWMGDMHPEILAISSVFGAHEIVEESMDFASKESFPPKFINNISAYSLYWLISQYDWYRLHGKLNYLERQKEYFIQLCEVLNEKIKDNTLSGSFIDWAYCLDMEIVAGGFEALLILALKKAVLLCKILNISPTKNLESLQILATKKTPVGSAKSVHALRVIAGLEKAESDFFANNPLDGVSTFHGYNILLARALANDEQGCFDLIKNYWYGMLDIGSTTFWEHFEVKWLENSSRIDEIPKSNKRDIHKEYGSCCFKGYRNSLCHGWGGGVTAFISEYILGVNVISYDQIQIKPHLGSLNWVEGSYPTRFGVIKIKHSRINGKIETSYSAPKEIKIEL